MNLNVKASPLYSPTTHLHGFCSLPNTLCTVYHSIIDRRLRLLGFMTSSVPFAERRVISLLSL